MLRSCATLAQLIAPALAGRRLIAAAAVLCVGVAGAFQFVPPLLMGRFLGVLIVASRSGGGEAAYHAMALLFAGVAASVFAIYVFQFVGVRCAVFVSTLAGRDLRRRVHAAALGMAFPQRSELDAGTLQTRIAADTASIEGLLSFTLPTVTIHLIFVAGAIALLIFRAPFMAPLVAVPLAIVVGAMFAVRRFVGPLLTESAAVSSTIAGRISELSNGARAIRLSDREPRQQRLFEDATQRLTDVARAIWTCNGGFQHALGINILICSYLLWYAGGLTALRPHSGLAVNDLLALIPIVMLLFAPFHQLTALLDSLPKALSAADRIGDLLSMPAESDAGLDVVPSSGTLEMRNVWFEYAAGSPVLRDCSLSIGSGEFVALTGRSGAGKSTIVNLIARLYRPDAGTLRWGPYAAEKVAPRSWRRAIGFVAQETFLFAESVRDNIRCGRDWISDDAIAAAAKIARADAFIAALPDGYDTMLGEGGHALSGGERQRLGIARALAADPALLVFDEPSAALDDETEAAFLDGLERVRRGRTVLLIAHRASTIARADRTLILSGGRIRENEWKRADAR